MSIWGYLAFVIKKSWNCISFKVVEDYLETRDSDRTGTKILDQITNGSTKKDDI